MHLSRSHHEKNPELERHAPRMIPRTTSRDARRYSDDAHHHSSRSGRSEYSHGRDRSYRDRESYSPPRRHRSRHDDYDDHDYDDRSRSDRHRDRSRHSTRHHSTHRSHSTHRRRGSDSPSYYQDRRYSDEGRRRSGDEERPRSGVEDRPRSSDHYRQKSPDHGHYQPPPSSHPTRPAFDRRRSRSVDERYLSRNTRSRDAPVYYHYQSGSYVPIPLTGNDLKGAARARAASTSQGAAIMSPSGRQPMVVPVDGGRGGWIVVPPVNHSVSVMEPKTTSGRSTATTVATAASALHHAPRRSSISPEAITSQPALPIQPTTTTISIAHPYVSVQPTSTSISNHHQPRQHILQPIQHVQTTTSSATSRRRAPQQSPGMPPSHRRPHKLVFPQPLSGAPSMSPRSAVPVAYTTPYGSGNSRSGFSGPPASQKKSGFGWGFFGSKNSRRSRGTSL